MEGNSEKKKEISLVVTRAKGGGVVGGEIGEGD